MKSYPTVTAAYELGAYVWEFDKLDGSNIRAEWSRKRGSFYKFGSRTRLIDRAEPVLGKSVDLITEKYDALNGVFRIAGYESVVCFFEFFGPTSFAGLHSDSDIHDVVLFDIAPYKRGILGPDDFMSHASTVETARLLFNGILTDEFVCSVRESTLPGMTFEGVVCKGIGASCKIKSHVWLDRLRTKCGQDEGLFKRLA